MLKKWNLLVLILFIRSYLALGQGLTGYVIINNGNEVTNDKDGRVTLSIKAEGGVPPIQMMISNNGSFTNAFWEPFVTSKLWRVPGKDGIKTVYVKFRDSKGNVSEVVSDDIELDRTGPDSASIIINSGRKYTNDKKRQVTLELYAQDAKMMQISGKPDFTGIPWRPYQQVVQNYQLIGFDGEKKVYARFQDAAGNITPIVEASIILDTQPPTNPKIDINDGANYTRNKVVHIKVKIEGDPHEMIIQGGEGWIPYKESFEWELLPGDGEKIIRMKFRDQVGNESPVVADKIILDTQPPTNGIVTINNGARYVQRHDEINLKLVVQGLPQTGGEMIISQSPDFKGAKWEPYTPIATARSVDPTNGPKTIYVKFRDPAGNESEVYSASIILDNVPPSNCSVSITSPDIIQDKNTGIKLLNADKKIVNLELKATDADYVMISNSSNFFNAKWERYVELYENWELSGQNDGERLVFVKFRDRAGNISGVVQDKVIIDTQAPVDCKVNIDGGAEYTINKDKKVQLQIFARNADYMMISNDPSFTDAKWEPYTTLKEWVLAGDDGLKSVIVKFKDAANNESQPVVDNIILDRQPPYDISIIINKGEEITNHPDRVVLVKVSAKDAVLMQISNDPQFSNLGNRWMGYSNLNITWQLSGDDGEKTVYARFKDEAGNVTEVISDKIKLDRKPPLEGKVTINEGDKRTNTNLKDVTLTLSAVGAKEMMLSNDFYFRNASWQPYQTSLPWTLEGGDGLKTVYVKFRDEIGNESKVAYAQIGIDTEAPKGGSISINKGETYCTNVNGYVTLHLSARDATEMMISNSPNFEKAKWIKYEHIYQNWILEGDDGEKSVYAKFRDKAGNETIPVMATIILDRQEPVGEDIIINNGEPFTNNKENKVSLELRAEGAVEMMISNFPHFQSPAKWQPYQERMDWTLIGKDGEKTIYVKYRDKAGNESAVAKAKILLDTEPPIPIHFKINDGATSTENPNVVLDIKARDAKYMMISNDPNFTGAVWEDYAEKKNWQLTAKEGLKTVYIKFKDGAQNVSEGKSAFITLYGEK
ncbi:MAG: hypothetical protein RMJ89_01355 [Flammeovirgaceae bacterium]|nr:hypothetical protein [Flammeovirgaceae bacterium]